MGKFLDDNTDEAPQGPLFSPTPTKGFLPESKGFIPDDKGVAPTADELRQIIYAPGSTYEPSQGDARVLYEAEQKKGLGQKVGEFGSAAASAASGVASDVAHKGKEVLKSVAKPGEYWQEDVLRGGLNVAEGLARNIFGLGQLTTKAGVKALDTVAPTTNDPVAAYHARLLANLKEARETADVESGKAAPLLTPTRTDLVNNDAAGLAQYVADPATLATGAGILAPVKAAGRAIAERGAVKGAEKVLGNVAAAGGKVFEAAKAPARIAGEKIEGTLPGTGLSEIAKSAIGAATAPITTGAKVVEKAAGAGQQLARTEGNGQFSRLQQLAMSATAPTWVKSAARNLSRIGVDDAAAGLANAAKSGAVGGAVGAVTVLPGAESAEELGAAAGSGFALGSLTHLALSPMTAGPQRRAAEDLDLARWYSRKSEAEQKNFEAAQVPREVAVKLMDVEAAANGVLDPQANVQFFYLPEAEYNASPLVKGMGEGTRGVTLVAGAKPTILFNLNRVADGTAYHELGHVLAHSPELFDLGGMLTRLFGVHDAQGKQVLAGMFPEGEFARRGEQYFQRFDAAGQQALAGERNAYNTDPNSPQGQVWAQRVAGEVLAELFANLSKSTEGSLMASAISTPRTLVDKALLSERPLVQKAGAVADKFFGTQRGESDILTGLKNTPQVDAALRESLRNKYNLNEAPTFDTKRMESEMLSFNPREVLRQGGDELLKTFGDNDNFEKAADGSVLRGANNAPVLRTEQRIKKAQAERATKMMEALAASPDAQAPAPGIVKPEIDKTGKPTFDKWSGAKFSDAQMANFKALPDNILTPSMKKKLETLNTGPGNVLTIDYNAATKNRRYSSAISKTIRQFAPLTLHISKAGNFFATGIDLTAFNRKLADWSGRKNVFADFNGSPEFFVQKTYEALANHQQGQPARTNLDPDPAKAKRMADSINDFINIRDIASESNNPDRRSGTGDKDKLIRSLRFDRINDVQATGERFDVDYNLQKANFSPEGEKTPTAYDTDWDKMGVDAIKTVRSWVNEGILRGREIKDRKNSLLITKPSHGDAPGTLFRITRMVEQTPTGHLEVSREQWNKFLQNPNAEWQSELGQVFESAQESVRPDLTQGTGWMLDEPTEFHYKLRLRDVGIGTAPVGFLRASGRDVVYSRPLTSQELYDFEISPIGAKPSPRNPDIRFSPEGEAAANQELRRARPRDEIEAMGLGRVDLDATTQKLNRESGQYSALEQVINQKVQGQSIPAAQLAAMLRNPQSGVKAEEIRWSGLDDFLKGKERVSKQEVLDFVRANRIQIEEKRLGEPETRPAPVWRTENGVDIYTSGTEEIARIKPNPYGGLSAELSSGMSHLFDTPEQARQWIESRPQVRSVQSNEARPTKFEQYKSPGGENYREVLFRFPDTTQVENGPTDHWNDARVFAHARVQDYIEHVPFAPDGPELVSLYQKAYSARQRATDIAKGRGADHPNAVAAREQADRLEADVAQLKQQQRARERPRKTLLIDELQSDWHQKGRKEGYAVNNVARLDELTQRMDAIQVRNQELMLAYKAAHPEWETLYQKSVSDALEALKVAVPEYAKGSDEFRQLYREADDLKRQNRDNSGNSKPAEAPFAKTWHEFIFKRMLRDAVEKGYDAIEWPDGGTIAKRFDLSQHITSLDYWSEAGPDGPNWHIDPRGGGDPMTVADRDLDAHVGEAVAARMRNGEGTRTSLLGNGPRTLRGDIELGSGESKGMKEFYDKMLPSFVNKYVKKWGSAVKDTVRGLAAPKWSVAPSEGRWSLRDATGKPVGAILQAGERFIGTQNGFQTGTYATLEAAKAAIEAKSPPDRSSAFPVHRVEITEPMRQEIKTKGQTLFSPDVPALEAKLKEIGEAHKDRVRSYVTINEKGIRLHDLAARKNAAIGSGSGYMRDLVKFADENNLIITLQTASKGDFKEKDGEFKSTTSTARLKKFYGNFGFKDNYARGSYRSDLPGNMHRLPQSK